jgi:ABC-2 type transport system ATP-binding protein
MLSQAIFLPFWAPHGAGKSTTIGIICSLVRKSSGTVKVFGTILIRTFSLAKQHVGVVPQELILISLKSPLIF